MTKVTLISNTEEKKNVNKIDKIDQVHSGGTGLDGQDYQKHPQKKEKATQDMAQDTRQNKNKTQQLIEIKEHKINPMFPDG